MLTFVARPDIVVDPYGEFFPVEVSSDSFDSFFLSEMSGYLRVVKSFCHLH